MLKEPDLTKLEEQILVYMWEMSDVELTVVNITAIFDIHTEYVEAAMESLKKHGYVK